MAIQLKRVNPFERREPIVEFFWRLRAWPYATKEDYFRYWDWRYASLSEVDPAVWIALDDGQIIGHIALYFRHLRIGNRQIVVGVPGNYLVDDKHRNSMIGPRLAGATRTMVRRGEIDMLLGYGNKIAHAMYVALGDRELGPMLSLVDVRQWYPVLVRRVAAASFLAPLAQMAARGRKAAFRPKYAHSAQGLVVRDLSLQEIFTMDRSHWAQSDSLICDGSPKYLANRFLKCPFRTHRVLGVMDERTGRLEGVLVTEGTTRVYIWDCVVNEAAISEVQAVNLASDAMPFAETVIVSVLPRSALAGEFRKAGLFGYSPENTDQVLGNTLWSAYWLPEHPQASVFAESSRWKLWYAWSHH